MPRGLKDITSEVHDSRGERLVVRLFFPALGDKAADEYGRRRTVFLEAAPMVQLYIPHRRRTRSDHDDLGRPFHSCSARTLLARRLKNGKLRVTPGRGGNGGPRHYSRTLGAAEVDHLLDLLANADEHLTQARAERRERVLARLGVRRALNLGLGATQRARQSALAG